MSVLLILGGVIMYSSIAYALHVVSRTYTLPLRLVAVELLGLIVSTAALTPRWGLGLPVVLVLVTLGLYPLVWLIFMIDMALHEWKYEDSFEDYRRSLLGLDTVYFHLANNEDTSIPLLYMVNIPPLMYIACTLICLGQNVISSIALAINMTTIPVLGFLALKALDRGYLKASS